MYMSKDVYTEVAEYIANLVVLCDYDAWLVKLSLDGRKTTEMLSYDREDGFTWANDWYEGESDVQVIDFVCVNYVDPAMRWHSVKKEGYPPDEQTVFVTMMNKSGESEVYDGFKYERDVSKLVDMRTKYGKQFVEDNKNGVWFSWRDDYWEHWPENEYYTILAWMPYPEPYRGD